MGRRVLVCSSQADLWSAGAHFILEKTLTTEKSSYRIALSGGSTPRGLYQALASHPFREQLPWPSIRLFWGDERPVPPDHPDSNFRMARESLLDHVPLAPDQVFRIEGERPPEDAASRYEEVLREHFHTGKDVPPRFDLLLLGMGPDAHTASLFPDTPALEETRRTVVANWVEKLNTFRITLTPPVLNAAGEVLFLVSGEDKADAVRTVLEGERRPRQYPAQLVNPTEGHVTWVLDRAAGSLLRKTSFTPWTQPKGANA